MTLHHRPDPFTECWHRLMSATDNLFSHFFELCPETLSDCITPYDEPIVLPGSTTGMREPKEVKRFHLPLSPRGTVCFREPSELDEPGLFAVDFKSEGGESFLHFLQETLRAAPILEPHDEVSQRRELPPSLLSEPDVNLSAHPAPIIQPTVISPFASARTVSVIAVKDDPTSVLHSCDDD
jgi:hypothetical protein